LTNSSETSRVKYFGLSTLAIEAAVQRFERQTGFDLGHRGQPTAVLDERYFPQFDQKVRAEAEAMAAHYRVFYCLENTIRTLVIDILSEAHGDDWWSLRVPDTVKLHVKNTTIKEIEAGVSQRSQEPIDYTTFGELGEIIKSNWDDFSDIFSNKKALEKVVGTLNTLRGPIAHCKPLAEDEVLRLHLSVRDWFRAMS
jgi:hypothetical protein